MSIGQTHRGHTFLNMLGDESYVKWAQTQDPVQDDLRAFKAFAKEFLDIKSQAKGSSPITEIDIKAEDHLIFYKMVTQQQSERAHLTGSIPCLDPEGVNWMSKGLMSTIIIGCNFTEINGLRPYQILKFAFKPDRIIGECYTALRPFTNPGHGRNLGLESEEIDLSEILEVIDFKVNCKSLVTHLRSSGYLVDYNSVDFNDQKSLYENCALLRPQGGYHPRFIEDIKTSEGIESIKDLIAEELRTTPSSSST